MTEPIARRAVVIGGSVAGMIAARVLSEHFREVIVLERDELEQLGGHARRRGAPQSEHVHILLRRGVELLEGWFPGIHDEMVGQGVRPFDFARDLRWYQYGGWLPRPESDTIIYPQTRRSLEGHIRRRLAGVPNVELRTGASVRNLLCKLDRSRVTGVEVEVDGAREQLSANLVVHAGGRSSNIYRWLEQLGCAPVDKTALRINLLYVSRFFRPPARPRDWRALWVSPHAPEFPRAGALQLVEGDRWLLSLAGYHGDEPSKDPERFLEFADKLPVPDIAEALVGAEPLTEPAVFRCAEETWHHIERAEDFPAGLVVIGDAYCNVDPVFGQGMSIAMVSCEWLSKHLRKLRSASDLDRAWTRGFYRDTSRWLTGMWTFITGEALRNPNTPGARTKLVRFGQAFVEQLYGLSRDDPSFYPELLKLTHMRAGPEFLLRPDVGLRLAARARRTGSFAAGQGPRGWSGPGPQIAGLPGVGLGPRWRRR